MVTRLVGDRLKTEARQVWEAFAHVAPRLANSLEVGVSVVWSRRGKLLQIETVPVSDVGFPLVKILPPGDPVARPHRMLCAKARDASAAAADNFVEWLAAVGEVLAEFDRCVNPGDLLGLFVVEALIGATKYRRGAGLTVLWRRDAPDRLLVEATGGGPSLTWQCS